MSYGTWTLAEFLTFTAAAGHATFTNPLHGQNNIDTTKAFSWNSVAGAQGYILAVGTTPNGSDLVNSGVLPANRSSYLLPTAPPYNVTMYATNFTEVNGTWTRYSYVSFSANPGVASFDRPLNGATNDRRDLDPLPNRHLHHR